MKNFENPTMSVTLFSTENIVTESIVTTAADAAKESLGIGTPEGISETNLFEFEF